MAGYKMGSSGMKRPVETEEIDKTVLIKRQLSESLGQREEGYNRLIKQWFKMKIEKEGFEEELKSLLTPDEIRLHNQLLRSFLDKCAHSSEKRDTTDYRKYYHHGKFEPINPLEYDTSHYLKLNCELPPSIAYERVLPDTAQMSARFLYGAWEVGLEGSSKEVAELLLIATMNFLKNVLTAIITRKRGFKTHRNHFIHDIGVPQANRWLKNCPKHEDFYGLKIDPDSPDGLKPEERITREELERRKLMDIALGEGREANVNPISLKDVYHALNIRPSVISSNLVYILNQEKILAKMWHPSWDEL